MNDPISPLPNNPAAAPGAERSPPAEAFRVLIIEDSVSFAKACSLALERAGVLTRVLHHAENALAEVDAFDPELLLLDVNLPKISGLAFGAAIRRDEKYNHIPIVFLTGDTAIGTRSEALQLGGDDFILKPVALDFLVESVIARLERARTTRQGSLQLRQALARLDRQTAQMTLALESTDSGTWEWLRDAGDIVYSESWKRLLGYSADQADEFWSVPFHPDDIDQKIAALGSHIEGITAEYVVECRVRNARGEWDWVAEVGRIVERDELGRPTHIVGTTRLVNRQVAMKKQRDSLQLELQQAQKMDAIGHLSAGIAHDFNNMLGAMLGYTELAQEMLQRPDAVQKLGRYLGEIMTAGTRAKELIAQMLLFSRLGPEQLDGEVPAIRIGPVAKEVANLLRSSIPATTRVNFQIDDADPKARIRPVHLHQIILNLGINARDAVGEYGTIDISVARRPADATCASCHRRFSGEFIEVAVKDNGRGIPEHLLGKVFDPFFTTKEIGQGSGMGLPVVHGVVHGLGGHLEVSSRVGQGTTVRVLLPQVDEPAVAPAEGAGAPDASVNGLRIMVVDDEQAMGAMLREHLSLRGAAVKVFDRPLLALEEFMRAPDAFDLIITDEAMPDLSGLDMATEMLRRRPGMPVILCSGYSLHATPETTRAAGIAAYMSKPLDIAELLRTAARATAGETTP